MHQLMRTYNKCGTTMVGCQTLEGAQVVLQHIIQSIATKKAGISRFLDVDKMSGPEADGKSAMLGRYVLLEATVGYALRRFELKEAFQTYLNQYISVIFH